MPIRARAAVTGAPFRRADFSRGPAARQANRPRRSRVL